MDTALLDGEYELNDRGLPFLVDGLSELMQRVALRLKTKKGSYIYLRELGSELEGVDDVEDAVHSRAELLAREAVADIPQRYIESLSASMTEEGRLKISLCLNLDGEQGQLEVVI